MEHCLSRKLNEMFRKEKRVGWIGRSQSQAIHLRRQGYRSGCEVDANVGRGRSNLCRNILGGRTGWTRDNRRREDWPRGSRTRKRVADMVRHRSGRSRPHRVARQVASVGPSRPGRARTAESTGKPDLFPGGCTGAYGDAENACGCIRPGRVCLQCRARPREFRLGYRLGLRFPGTATKLVGQPAGPAVSQGRTVGAAPCASSEIYVCGLPLCGVIHRLLH